MTYLNIAGLASDPQFNLRLQAGCTEQATIYVNDQRADYVALANEIVKDSGNAMWFTWPVASAPGFADQFASGGSESISDGQILSAIQSLWPGIAKAHDLGQEVTP